MNTRFDDILGNKEKNSSKLESVLLGGGLILVLLLIWEGATRLGWANPVFSSSPSRVVKTLFDLIKKGDLWRHISASSKLFFLGYGGAIVIGVPLGIAIGWFEKLRKAVEPLLSAIYVIPRIALMPLFIIWFGLGIESKLVLVFLSAFFNITINMQTAMMNLNKDLTKVAVAYGANMRQFFFTIALPQAVPYLITGLRLAAGRALVGVVGAEVFGGAEGLGYLIQYAGATFQTNTVFACVFVFAIIGISIDRILYAIGKKFDTWH